MQKLKNKKLFKSNKRRKLKEEKIKSWNQNLKKKSKDLEKNIQIKIVRGHRGEENSGYFDDGLSSRQDVNVTGAGSKIQTYSKS